MSTLAKKEQNQQKQNNFKYKLKSFFAKALIATSLLNCPIYSQLNQSNQINPNSIPKKVEATKADTTSIQNSNLEQDTLIYEINIEKFNQDTLVVPVNSNTTIVLIQSNPPISKTLARMLANSTPVNNFFNLNMGAIQKINEYGFPVIVNPQEIIIGVPDSIYTRLNIGKFKELKDSHLSILQVGSFPQLGGINFVSGKNARIYGGLGFYVANIYNFSAFNTQKENKFTLYKLSDYNFAAQIGANYYSTNISVDGNLLFFDKVGYQLNLGGALAFDAFPSVPNALNIFLAAHYNSNYLNNFRFINSNFKAKLGMSIYRVGFALGTLIPYNSQFSFYELSNYYRPSFLSFSFPIILVNKHDVEVSLVPTIYNLSLLDKNIKTTGGLSFIEVVLYIKTNSLDFNLSFYSPVDNTFFYNPLYDNNTLNSYLLYNFSVNLNLNLGEILKP